MNKISISDFNMPFMSMVNFIVKLVLASIVAFIFLAVILFPAFLMVVSILSSLGE